MSKISWQCATSYMYLYNSFSFGVGVKHNAPANKPTKTTNSFHGTDIVSTVNLGIKSLSLRAKLINILDKVVAVRKSNNCNIKLELRLART